MGRYMDESLLSTASTLIDSCSGSVNESLEDEEGKSKNVAAKSFVCRGRITEDSKANSKLSSPTTTAISLEITESATQRSDRTTGSKLDIIRAKNRRLRKQASLKLEESRASLRKSRTVAIAEESTPTAANPPPYPPPSVHNEVKAARLEQEQSEPSADFKHNPDAEFSDFLRRSNSVIDRLSTEIAMAGTIINQSVDCDTTFNDSVANKKNDFASNLCVGHYYNRIGQDEKSIQNDENSIHNISVGEDWDQTTISATLEGGTPTNSLRQRSVKVPATTRPISQSGLPPPEVVVKRVTPRAPPPATIREVDISYSSETTATTYPPRSSVDRHLRQRPPSIYSSRGDCGSMYNTNQRVEKLALENDCLKRQLDLLESRHRDSQRKLMEQFHLKGDEILEEDHPETVATPTSIKKKYGLSRKEKKKSERRRFAVLLLFGPFLVSSIIWFYQSFRSAPTVGFGASDGIDINSIMRDGVLGNSAFNEAKEPLFSDASDVDDEESFDIDDLDEASLEVHDIPPQFSDFDGEEDGESSSGKKEPRFKRMLSRLKLSHKNTNVGAWYDNHRHIAIEKYHSEL